MAAVSSFAPILASLRKHRLTAALLFLQVVLTSAIVCNVLSMIAARMQAMSVVSGIGEDELSVVDVQSASTVTNWPARRAATKAALLSLPHVTGVAVVDTYPLGRSQSSQGVCNSLDALAAAMRKRSLDGGNCLQVATISAGPGIVGVLGLKLVRGRDFLPGEFVSGHAASVLVSATLARRLFGSEDAVGRSIYSGSGASHPLTVVGVASHLLRPSIREQADAELTMIQPVPPADGNVSYLIRSPAARGDQVLGKAQAAVLASDHEVIIDPGAARRFADVRRAYFSRDASMVALLATAALALVFVTMVGVAGLAKFWVLQRRRQIGIRRALGATRRDILVYFHLENLVITGAGVLVGIPLAFVLGAFLIGAYGAAAMSPWLVFGGAALVLVTAQLAVHGPARNASRVIPMEAVRG